LIPLLIALTNTKRHTIKTSLLETSKREFDFNGLRIAECNGEALKL